MVVSGWGYSAQNCTASGTASVQIDASGHLLMVVKVAGTPVMGPLGECTTNATAAMASATGEGVTKDDDFDFLKCGDAGLTAAGMGRFPGSGPDAGKEIVAHLDCNGTDGQPRYTLDAVVMH